MINNGVCINHFENYNMEDFRLDFKTPILVQIFSSIEEETMDLYLKEVHRVSVADIKGLRNRVHNLKLKHFHSFKYNFDMSVAYQFKGDTIFSIKPDTFGGWEVYYIWRDGNESI